MAAIVGAAGRGKQSMVYSMLQKLAHRSPAGQLILDVHDVTLGVGWPVEQSDASEQLRKASVALDSAGESHFALAYGVKDSFFFKRDPIGVAPLYYGYSEHGILCFASEVKALLGFVPRISEMPPGSYFNGSKVVPYYSLSVQPSVNDPPNQIAAELYSRLKSSVERCLGNTDMGVWLSGGLDSSTLASLARPLVSKLHTFTVGLPGSPDLVAASLVSRHLNTLHHERIVWPADLLAVLPQTIYHLESFDCLLVRSAVMNLLVSKLASDYVPSVLSGEGSDELFAGYTYLKNLDLFQLDDEIIALLGALHNTALQRVDRCASAHGTIAHVRFLDPDIVEYALQIPAEYKIYRGVNKWILRKAMEGTLPKAILSRPKSKFWEGSGVGNLLANYAEATISDLEFQEERNLINGWQIASKEELMYYRIFCQHFGVQEDLSWMGRIPIRSISRTKVEPTGESDD
jgi:asparagine synthase (glutamine-hydrolysing)